MLAPPSPPMLAKYGPSSPLPPAAISSAASPAAAAATTTTINFDPHTINASNPIGNGIIPSSPSFLRSPSPNPPSPPPMTSFMNFLDDISDGDGGLGTQGEVVRKGMTPVTMGLDSLMLWRSKLMVVVAATGEAVVDVAAVLEAEEGPTLKPMERSPPRPVGINSKWYFKF